MHTNFSIGPPLDDKKNAMKIIFWSVLTIFSCFNILKFCKVIKGKRVNRISTITPRFFNSEILVSDLSRIGNIKESEPFSDLNSTLNSSEVKTSIVIENLRCNEFQVLKIFGENTGSTIVDGTLWLEINSNVFNVEYIDTPDTKVGLNLNGWHFNDFVPSTNIYKQVRIGISRPTSLTIGDRFQFKSYVTFRDTNGDQVSSIFECSEIVECLNNSSYKKSK